MILRPTGSAEQRVLLEAADLQRRLGGAAAAPLSASGEVATPDAADERLAALQAEAALLRQSPTGECSSGV